MAYCTSQQLIDRKGSAKIAQLTGDPQGQTVDVDDVTAAIDDFASRLDASIRKQYPDLPFDQEHKYLSGLNIEGAYLILERDSERGWSDEYRSDWKVLMDELKQIAAGNVDLREGEAIEEYTDGYFRSSKRLFGRNSLSPDYHE